jgi:hypothetical protein
MHDESPTIHEHNTPCQGMQLSVKLSCKQHHNLSHSLTSARVTNWLSTGGTLRRMLSTRRWRCRRTYLGHLTKRRRSRLGAGLPPRPVWKEVEVW